MKHLLFHDALREDFANEDENIATDLSGICINLIKDVHDESLEMTVEVFGRDGIHDAPIVSEIIYDPEAIKVLESCLKHLDLPKETTVTPLAHLRPGMVLAEDVYGTNGWLIAPAGELLGSPQITRLRQFNHVSPLPSEIAVYE